MSEEEKEEAPVSGGEEEAPPAAEEQADAAPAPQNEQDLAPVAAPAAAAVDMFANMNLMDNDDEDSESTSDDDEDPLASLPNYVLQRVEKLKDLHAKRDEIMEQYLVDRAALEQKYHALCKPLYDERAAIIKGSKDSEKSKKETKEDESKTESQDEQEATQVETVEEGDDDADKEADDNEGDDVVEGIPQFWVCAMSHIEPLAELITEEDVDCLEHLYDIACVDDPDGTGFTLEFHFEPNDYFHNTVLTKKYEVPNLLLDDEPILKNVEGCKIQWKSDDQCLTFRYYEKKQRGKGKNVGMVRTVKKKERRESFFHFFEPPRMPSMDDMDEEEADRLEQAFEADYDFAQAFRSHIIPKAVMWFTGQVSLCIHISLCSTYASLDGGECDSHFFLVCVPKKALQEEMDQMFTEAGGQAGGGNPFPPSAPGERPPECDQQN